MERRFVAVVLAVVLTTVTAPALADHGDEDDHGTLLASADGLDNGWSVVEFEVEEDGTDLYLWRLAEDAHRPTHVGSALFSADGDLEAWSTLQGFGGEGLHVEPSATGTLADDWEDSEYPSGDAGSHTFVRGLDAGAYVFAFWWAFGETTGSSYAFHGDDVTVTGETTGDDAFVHSVSSFDGDVKAHAGTGATLTGSHALVGGEIDVDVDDTLVFYGHSRMAGTVHFALDTPEGAEGCPCVQMDATGEDRMGPGAYGIELTAAGPGDIIAAGADIQFPFE